MLLRSRRGGAVQGSADVRTIEIPSICRSETMRSPSDSSDIHPGILSSWRRDVVTEAGSESPTERTLVIAKHEAGSWMHVELRCLVLLSPVAQCRG